MEHSTHKKINGVDPQLLSLMNQSPNMTCIRCGPLRCSGAKQTGTGDAGMWPSRLMDSVTNNLLLLLLVERKIIVNPNE